MPRTNQPTPDPVGASPTSSSDTSAHGRLLEAAFDLFHERGVRATSVEQILELSGTGKSQLYHYFGSKDGLIQAVVEGFEARLLLRDLPGSRPISTIEDLECWFEAFVDVQRSTGCARFCPMATIAAGLRADQEPVRVVIDRIFQHARGVLDGFFEKMEQQGKLTPGVRPQTLSDFCYTIMQGGLLVSRVRLDPAPFEHAVEHALNYVRITLRENHGR